MPENKNILQGLFLSGFDFEEERRNYPCKVACNGSVIGIRISKPMNDVALKTIRIPHEDISLFEMEYLPKRNKESSWTGGKEVMGYVMFGALGGFAINQIGKAANRAMDKTPGILHIKYQQEDGTNNAIDILVKDVRDAVLDLWMQMKQMHLESQNRNTTGE
ncbi:hypothetical protein LJC20_04095 [Eubacteriales bacterium OttesenSCG-928-M02]|nr:hypothetical protein [Eubacteriales bacterium OttesenSCG-928-M02]